MRWLLYLVLAGCTQESAVGGPPTCIDVQTAVDDWASKHHGCSVDGDCTGVIPCPDAPDSAQCLFPINQTGDTPQFSSLRVMLWQCDVCLGCQVGVPRCLDGKCQMR